MTIERLRNRVTALEKSRMIRKAAAGERVLNQAMRTMSDQDLELLDTYQDKMMQELQPTEEELAAANRYERAVEVACWAARFRSVPEFKEVWLAGSGIGK